MPTGGTALQVLTKTSATDYATAWQAPAAPPAGTGGLLTTKGDLVGRSASADVRIPVGATGYVLKADAAWPNGVVWTSTLGSMNFVDASTSGILVGVDATDATGDRIAGHLLKRRGSPRWLVGKTSNAEGGANAGSDFYVYRYDDAGAGLGQALGINRASGLVTIPGALTVGGKLITPASLAGAAGLNAPHGVAPTAPANGDLWTTTAGLYARINGATVGPLGAGGGGGAPGGATTQLQFNDAGAFGGAVNTVYNKATGALTLNGPVTLGSDLHLDRAAGTDRALRWRSSGSERWVLDATSAAESGGGAGSDLALYRYDDAGGFLGPALSFSRATAAATFAGNVTAPELLATGPTAQVVVGDRDGGNGYLFYAQGGAFSVYDRNRYATVLSINNTGAAAFAGAITSGGSPVITQTTGDARYEPLDSAYTKAEADAKYALAGAYLTQATADPLYVNVTGAEAMAGPLSLGTNPAAAGIVRLPNNQGLSWRNAANTADITLTVSASNLLYTNTHLIPASTNNHDLGATAVRWRKTWAVDGETTNVPTIGGVSMDTRYALASALTALTTRVATLEAQILSHTHQSGTVQNAGGAAIVP